MILPSLVARAYAALQPINISDTNSVPSNNTSLTSIFRDIGNNIADILLLIAGIAAVLYIVYYGIMYITAGGSPDRTKQARAGIINAIWGIVIIVAAYGIVRLGVQIGYYFRGAFTNTP